MQRRKQSVVTLSFQSGRDDAPKFYSRSEAGNSSESGREKSSQHNRNTDSRETELSRRLMDLCREIGGALLSHHAAGKDLKAARKVITEGLMQTVGCRREQASCLVELSMELIHVNAYGRYKRNPLELSLLIQDATGQGQMDVSKN